MFEIFGNSEEVKKLKKRIDRLYMRVEELDKRVNPPDRWNLHDAIYGIGNQSESRSTWGLWKRLAELEKCVFGHSGLFEPAERPAIYASLNKLEEERCTDTVEKLQARVEKLEKKNAELLKEIKNLEKILIDSVNKQLGNIV